MTNCVRHITTNLNLFVISKISIALPRKNKGDKFIRKLHKRERITRNWKTGSCQKKAK